MFPFIVYMRVHFLKLFWFATLLNSHFFSFQYFSWAVSCNNCIAILLSCLHTFTTISRLLSNSLSSRKFCLPLDFNETGWNILLMEHHTITLAFKIWLSGWESVWYFCSTKVFWSIMDTGFYSNAFWHLWYEIFLL